MLLARLLPYDVAREIVWRLAPKAFAKPPSHEGHVFIGAPTVYASGKPLARDGGRRRADVQRPGGSAGRQGRGDRRRVFRLSSAPAREAARAPVPQG